MTYRGFSVTFVILFVQPCVLVLIGTFFPNESSNRRVFTAVFSRLSHLSIVELCTVETSKFPELIITEREGHEKLVQ